MRNFLHLLSIFSLQSYNSLKMNNLHKLIAIKDIYFIYIGEIVSKKLINKIVVSSRQGSKYFLSKLLYYNYLV